MKVSQKLMWSVFAAGMVISFQNCGKHFQPAESSQSLSSQCNAKLLSDAASLKLSPSELNCGDFNAYACERRIFSPDAVDISESIKECLPGDRICVDVDVRQFNTAGARSSSPDNALSFAPGGEFNHEEIHCYHRMVYRGMSLFEGAADSLEESLAKAMAACEQAVGS